MDSAEARKKILSRFGELEAQRNTWTTVWQDLRDYVLPYHGKGLSGDSATETNDGTRKGDKIIDGVATRAMGILGAGLQSGLTSQARPWFRLGVPDPSLTAFDPVKVWLYEVEDRMRYVMAKSNLYNSLHHVYLELGNFGTAAMAILDSLDTAIRVRPFTVGEYWISLNAENKVDTFYRKFWYSARQMVESYGLDRCSNSVKQAYRDKPEQLFQILQVIEPNDDRWDAGVAFPFRSLYLEPCGDANAAFLKVGGFDDFPVMTPRWHVVGQDVYGYSPAMNLLGDIKMLQKLQEKGLVALDKLVEPPVVAPSSMKNVAINTMPGGVNYNDDAINGRESLRSLYNIQPDLNHLEVKIQNVRADIKNGLFNDLFLMLASSAADKTMTATEVAQRYEEKLIMLGPVLDRTHSELLNPIIDRVFNHMQRLGMVPPPPKEISGMELKVEYISLLSQAQKMVTVTGIQQFTGFVASMAQTWPEALDKLDADDAIEKYADSVGTPPTMVRNDEDVKRLREDRAMAQQAAQQGQAMAVAAKGAKDLSQADMGGNNALRAITAGLGGAASATP